MCRDQLFDIETCSECYGKSTAQPEWFTAVCQRPHLLLWAKLKGFPYWPAKAMAMNGSQLVDVRFFGDHQRAWLSPKDCYLYSAVDPNMPGSATKRNKSVADSIKVSVMPADNCVKLRRWIVRRALFFFKKNKRKRNTKRFFTRHTHTTGNRSPHRQHTNQIRNVCLSVGQTTVAATTHGRPAGRHDTEL